MTSIRTLIQRAIDFIQRDIWRIRRSQLSPVKAVPITLLRTLILSLRGFDAHKGQLRASALTFYSLMSIVPVAAMAFGIAKGFGFEKALQNQLRTKLAGQEEILDKVIAFSHSLLETTKGGVLAGVGLAVLFWAVIKLLGQIEDSMNDIWGVQERRSLGRTFSDYLSLMLVCPVLIILSSSVTVFISTQVTMIMEQISLLGAFSPVVLMALKLLPYSVLWGLFTFIYMFMPNTKVRFSSALVAGIVAGTVFEIVQWAYITFQVGTVKYNAIYGSFAALPLFLVWLQLAWMIVLYGAELSFAWQGVDDHEFEADARQTSHRLRVLLSLQVVYHLIRRFIEGGTPQTARELSSRMALPSAFVREILYELVQCHLVSQVESASAGDPAFQPARDVNGITIQGVVDELEKRGVNTLPDEHPAVPDTLAEALESLRREMETLPANRLLKDL